MNYRLHGFFHLRSPLSHIGEAIGTNSYLVQEPIWQQDGGVTEVFCYSGNAWRGQLRDLSAIYMLDKLGAPRISADAFHLLFAGGKIGGDQVVDLNAIRAWRKSIPMIAVFGGGVGNQILPGKLRVSNSYPLCREAHPVLPASVREAATGSYSQMTFEKSFTRTDDAKKPDLEIYSSPPRGQLALAGAATPRGKGDDEVATQMRVTAELLIAGVKLYTEVDLLNASEVELGVIVAAIHQFATSPFIGGQSSRGHGRVDLSYELTDLATGEEVHLLDVADGRPLLAPRAEAAKQAYDDYLREQYDQMLAQQKSQILQLIEAAK